MNANELADEFKNRDWDEVDAVLWCEKAATMLRQQQAEIEALKKQCADIHENGAQVIDRCDKKIEELIEELNNLQVSYDKLWDTASHQQAEIEALKQRLFEMQNANIDLVKQFKGYAQQPNQDQIPEWWKIELRKAQEK